MSVSTAFLALAHLLTPALFDGRIDLREVAVQNAPATALRAASADAENWRLEAATHLKLPAHEALLLVIGAKSEAVPRCVRLNNYWCVKGRGWTGQFGSDGNGHAAFMAASAGARAAAVLLRHYYVELGRRSALDITSHWAPDRCGLIVTRARTPPLPPSAPVRPPVVLDIAKMSPEARMAAFDRIIAARRKAATEQYRQWLQFVKAANAGLLPPKPRPASPTTTTQAARSAPATMTPMFCGFEQRRIAAYARQAIRGIAQTTTADLQLFSTDGRSTRRAERMLLNMAAVEIGPRTVDENLVDRALRGLDAEMVPLSAIPHFVAAEQP